MNDSARLIFKTIGMVYPMLFFVLYVATGGLFGEGVPFSLEAFYQPYTGENAALYIGPLIAGLALLFFFNVKSLPSYLASERTHLIAIVFPESFAVIGFVIGFMNSNPWAALPYILIAFLNYVVVYQRIGESG